MRSPELFTTAEAVAEYAAAYRVTRSMERARQHVAELAKAYDITAPSAEAWAYIAEQYYWWRVGLDRRR